MLLDLTKLQNRKENELIFNEVITLNEEMYKDTDIRCLSPLDVSINIHRVTDSDYSMELNIKGTMAPSKRMAGSIPRDVNSLLDSVSRRLI